MSGIRTGVDPLLPVPLERCCGEVGTCSNAGCERNATGQAVSRLQAQRDKLIDAIKEFREILALDDRDEIVAGEVLFGALDEIEGDQ